MGAHRGRFTNGLVFKSSPATIQTDDADLGPRIKTQLHSCIDEQEGSGASFLERVVQYLKPTSYIDVVQDLFRLVRQDFGQSTQCKHKLSRSCVKSSLFDGLLFLVLRSLPSSTASASASLAFALLSKQPC